MPKGQSSTTKKKSDRGGFFAIDRRIWERAFKLGMNPAVGYLVLAQGTAGDNRHTSWSASSIHAYAGMTFARAKTGIESLIGAGLARHGEKHTPKKPRYELLSWAEISKADYNSRMAALSTTERTLIDKARAGLLSRETYIVTDLTRKGFLRKTENRWEVVEQADSEPDWIWLPNTLVTGTSKGEESPVKRVRGTGDTWVLRLLVDLYQSQNLRDDGGISPFVLRRNFAKKQIGQQGSFTLWAFKAENSQLWWEGPCKAHQERGKRPNGDALIWESIGILVSLGLLSFVPHIWENDSEQSEIVHAYGIDHYGGEPIELEIAGAADVGLA